MNKTLLPIVVWMSLQFTHCSFGQIIGNSGSTVVIEPPPTVETGSFESNSQIRVFVEHQAISLADNLNVDISLPGAYSSLNSFTPDTLAAKTAISSTYIHFDPIGQSGLVTRSGSLIFDNDILGVQFRTLTLEPGQLLLGHPNTTYPNGNNNPYGADYGQDVVNLSSDRRTLFFQFSTNHSADSLRVITAIPEPNMLLATAIPMCVISFLRNRNRRQF